MTQRWAFVAAVDKYPAPDLPAAPYAEAGAIALSEALAAGGIPRERQTLCVGPNATRLRLEVRLRQLTEKLKEGDEVVVALSGRCRAGGNGEPEFLPWDALPDALPDCGFPVTSLLTDLGVGRPAVLLFDAETLPGADDDIDWDFLTHVAPNAAILSACRGGEANHTAAALKASAWLHLVCGALAGRAPRAADKGVVTAESLQRYVAAELPRLLRRHFDGSPEQTPERFGPRDRVLFEGSADESPAGNLDAGRLKRVVFRSDSHGKVKELGGFRKGFNVPENTSASNRRFVAKLAAPDLKADLETVFEACREHLGYKRRDADVSVESDGFGFLRGPDFEYTVSVNMDPDDPSRVLWRREVGQLADPAFLKSDGFEAVFGKLFDELAFEFQTPVDVPALVDRLEDRTPPGVKVRVGSDASECEVLLSGFTGRVVIDRGSLRVRGRAGDPAGLLEQFLRFVRTVGPLGEPLALPG